VGTIRVTDYSLDVKGGSAKMSERVGGGLKEVTSISEG
jgi:hypothetical protein